MDIEKLNQNTSNRSRSEKAKNQWQDYKKSGTYLEVCKKMQKKKSNLNGNQNAKGNIPWNKDKVGLMPVPWNKGIPMSEVTKKKVSESKKANPTKYWQGKKRPEMNQVEGWNKTGKEPWNKGKKCIQLSGKNHWNWKGGINQKECEFCNKEYQPNYNTQRFCSGNCRIEWIKKEGILKGKNNGMFIHGERAIYNYSFKEISKKLRNNFVCYICNTKDDLLVHHVNLNKFDDSPTNLSVMCRPHHSEIHGIINRLSK